MKSIKSNCKEDGKTRARDREREGGGWGGESE